MTKRFTFVVAVIILVAGFLAWFAMSRPHSVEEKSTSGVTTKAKTSSLPNKVEQYAEMAVSRVSNSLAVGGSYPSWRGGRSTGLNDPRWKVVNEREKSDKQWDWKMPIEFYGKAVDENDQPVPDALVKFSWTDLSLAGTTRKETRSDGAGLFSLAGVRGKFLGVEVEKAGYDVVRAKNRYGFEYAGFWEKKYYEPDPKNPVLFHLRKKGEAAPIVRWEKEFKVAIGTPVTVQLDSQTQIQFELLSNVHPHFGQWEARVTMTGGGLMLATDEFPYEAPGSGYATSMVIDAKTPKPPLWQLGQGGVFYIKADAVYGRMNIEMEPGNDWFRFKLWLNPSGSRNLETDPKLTFPDLESYNRYMVEHGGKPVVLESASPKP